MYNFGKYHQYVWYNERFSDVYRWNWNCMDYTIPLKIGVIQLEYGTVDLICIIFTLTSPINIVLFQYSSMETCMDYEEDFGRQMMVDSFKYCSPT